MENNSVSFKINLTNQLFCSIKLGTLKTNKKKDLYEKSFINSIFNINGNNCLS